MTDWGIEGMISCHTKAGNWDQGARLYLPAVGKRCSLLNLGNSEPDEKERYAPREDSLGGQARKGATRTALSSV